MKVAILNLAFDLDLGTGRELVARFGTLASLAGALSRAGAEVAVLQRFRADEDLETDGDAAGTGAAPVRWHLRSDDPARPFAGPRARPAALFELAARLEPDAVLVNGLMFPSTVAELRLRLPRSTAIAVQHHAGGPADGWLGLQQRVVRGAADGFLFTASGIAEPWRAAGAIGPEQPVFEVPEASSSFVAVPGGEARRRTGVEGAPALLWVGRLHPRKDPLTALRAAALALEHLPGLRLYAAFGEAPMLADVETFLDQAPALGDRTRLLGRLGHEQLADWYSAAELFVTTSPDEGSNFALIEALACGLPSVASDIPAHRALAGESAEYFPAGDAHAAAAAIVRASERSAREASAVRAAVRARFEAELSWSAVARRTLAALEALALARRGA